MKSIYYLPVYKIIGKPPYTKREISQQLLVISQQLLVITTTTTCHNNNVHRF